MKFEILFGAPLKSFGHKMRSNKLQDNEIPSKSVHTKTLFNCFLHVYLILRWRITCKRIFFKFKARILKIDFRWSIWLNFCRKLKITGCKATSLSNIPTSFKMHWLKTGFDKIILDSVLVPYGFFNVKKIWEVAY